MQSSCSPLPVRHMGHRAPPGKVPTLWTARGLARVGVQWKAARGCKHSNAKKLATERTTVKMMKRTILRVGSAFLSQGLMVAPFSSLPAPAAGTAGARFPRMAARARGTTPQRTWAVVVAAAVAAGVVAAEALVYLAVSL